MRQRAVPPFVNRKNAAPRRSSRTLANVLHRRRETSGGRSSYVIVYRPVCVRVRRLH